MESVKLFFQRLQQYNAFHIIVAIMLLVAVFSMCFVVGRIVGSHVGEVVTFFFSS